MRRIKHFGMLLATITVMASCAGSDSNQVTLYGDAVVSAFSLGTLNCYNTVVATDGSDSIVKSTIAASSVRFRIDQLERQIYNVDSLPQGTDLEHVLCNVSVKNNGSVYILDKDDNDVLHYYSASDSIDFTSPRIFRVYASDMSGFTDYVVRLNVHQGKEDEFRWERVATDYTPADDATVLPAGISKILGGCMWITFAMSDEGRLMSSADDGMTWEEEEIDADPTLLPTEDLSLAVYPMRMSTDAYQVVLVGNRNTEAYPDDKTAMVWRKIVDFGEEAPASRWTYIDRTGETQFLLPRLDGLSIVRYDDSLLAFGKPYDKIYQSRDNGIIWKESSTYSMPEGFNTDATNVRVEVDGAPHIWLYCEGTGEVWRGQLNRLAWGKD